MNYLNLYKGYLVKELMKNSDIQAEEALRHAREFALTKEGKEGFIKWRNAQLLLSQKSKPEPVKKFITKLHDKLNPIVEITENDFDPKVVRFK